MSQCARLLDRLERGPITPMEAWNELGIYRLASRVKDLRDKGHVISGSRANVANRFGETCNVARYSLEKLMNVCAQQAKENPSLGGLQAGRVANDQEQV